MIMQGMTWLSGQMDSYLNIGKCVAICVLLLIGSNYLMRRTSYKIGVISVSLSWVITMAVVCTGVVNASSLLQNDIKCEVSSVTTHLSNQDERANELCGKMNSFLDKHGVNENLFMP